MEEQQKERITAMPDSFYNRMYRGKVKANKMIWGDDVEGDWML